MGEPATPTAQDRAETLALCRAIVESVREDERMPLGLPAEEFFGRRVLRRSDVEQLAIRLAQLATLLAEQLAEVRAARDEACDLATAAIGQIECGYDEGQASNIYSAEQRIAALRKVGAL